MKILADQNIDPKTAALVAEHGYAVFHTASLGLWAAPDTEILRYCRINDFVLLTLDKRLNKFLADERASSPSLLLLRDYADDSDAVADILAALPVVASNLILDGGHAIYTIRRNKFMRVRSLPFHVFDDLNG